MPDRFSDMLVIYAIAARLFDRAVAHWAALFMAFFRRWCSGHGMYKDPATQLCIAVSCTRCSAPRALSVGRLDLCGQSWR